MIPYFDHSTNEKGQLEISLHGLSPAIANVIMDGLKALLVEETKEMKRHIADYNQRRKYELKQEADRCTANVNNIIKLIAHLDKGYQKIKPKNAAQPAFITGHHGNTNVIDPPSPNEIIDTPAPADVADEPPLIDDTPDAIPSINTDETVGQANASITVNTEHLE